MAQKKSAFQLRRTKGKLASNVLHLGVIGSLDNHSNYWKYITQVGT